MKIKDRHIPDSGAEECLGVLKNLAAPPPARENAIQCSGSGTLSAHADLQTEIILMEMLYDYYYYYYDGGKLCSVAQGKALKSTFTTELQSRKDRSPVSANGLTRPFLLPRPPHFKA